MGRNASPSAPDYLRLEQKIRRKILESFLYQSTIAGFVHREDHRYIEVRLNVGTP